MWKRKLVKILHTLAAFAYAGGIAAYLFVLMAAPEVTDVSQHLALRTSLAFVAKWLIIPGMVVVLVSGLVAMMLHYPFMEQGWVWLKAVSGVLVFEASLASIEAPARRAKEAAERAVAGEFDLAELSGLIQDEWMALWILLGLAVANTVLGVWRPRLTRPRTTSNEPWFKREGDDTQSGQTRSEGEAAKA